VAARIRSTEKSNDLTGNTYFEQSLYASIVNDGNIGELTF
jgi:hypothetical protein